MINLPINLSAAELAVIIQNLFNNAEIYYFLHHFSDERNVVFFYVEKSMHIYSAELIKHKYPSLSVSYGVDSDDDCWIQIKF